MPSGILPAVGKAVIGAGVSKGIDAIFGGGSSGTSVTSGGRPLTVATPGLSITPGLTLNDIAVQRSPYMQKLTGQLYNSGVLASRRIGNLRGSFLRGARSLENVRVRALHNAREKAVGNLRDNLARRRVLGSSFGEDALTRSELSFAEAEDKIRAESFLQQLDLSLNLIKEQNDTFQQAVSLMIDQGNFETSAGINFANGAQQAASNLSKTISEIAVANAQGRGKLIGKVLDEIDLGGIFGGGIEGTAARDVLFDTQGIF